MISAHGSATVLVILGASSIFAWLVADQCIGQITVELVFAVSREPWIVLLMINAVFFIAELFLDPLAALIILVPIFLPLAQAIGLDLVHFGLVIVFNPMISLCVPPVGYLKFLTANIAQHLRPTSCVSRFRSSWCWHACCCWELTCQPSV